MKKENPGGNRGFQCRGRQGAAPGFPPVAAWRASRLVSTQTVTSGNLTPCPVRLPAESKTFWGRP